MILSHFFGTLFFKKMSKIPVFYQSLIFSHSECSSCSLLLNFFFKKMSESGVFFPTFYFFQLQTLPMFGYFWSFLTIFRPLLTMFGLKMTKTGQQTANEFPKIGHFWSKIGENRVFLDFFTKFDLRSEEKKESEKLMREAPLRFWRKVVWHHFQLDCYPLSQANSRDTILFGSAEKSSSFISQPSAASKKRLRRIRNLDRNLL